jgi:hypothetical protein
MVSESVSYVQIGFEPGGIAMTGEVKGEMAVAQFRSLVEACAKIAGRPRDDQARPAGNSERDEEATTPNPTDVAAQQYLYSLLGFICMGCGSWGIYMKYSLDLPTGFISWMGSAYGPTLRFAAVACLAAGAVLVRRGLVRPDMSLVSGSRNHRDRPAGTAHAMQREHPFDGRV